MFVFFSIATTVLFSFFLMPFFDPIWVKHVLNVVLYNSSAHHSPFGSYFWKNFTPVLVSCDFPPIVGSRRSTTLPDVTPLGLFPTESSNSWLLSSGLSCGCASSHSYALSLHHFHHQTRFLTHFLHLHLTFLLHLHHFLIVDHYCLSARLCHRQ